MQVHYFTDTYAPSKELKFRLRKMAEIAAISKLCNQEELYSQAKKQYDSMASRYNAVAETKKRGFWGKFWDNLSNTTTYVQMVGPMEETVEYKFTYSSFSEVKNKSELVLILEYKLNELKRGYDTMSALDGIRR